MAENNLKFQQLSNCPVWKKDVMLSQVQQLRYIFITFSQTVKHER